MTYWYGSFQRPEKYSAIVFIDGDKYVVEVPERRAEFVFRDAASAIQIALNMLSNGGILFIRNGVYPIYTSISIPYDNIVVEGENSVLEDHVASGDLITCSKNNIIFRNIRISIAVAKTSGYEINLSGSNNIVIDSIEINGNGGGIGINIYGNNVVVANNRFLNLSTAINISGASDNIVIANNIFSGNTTNIANVSSLGAYSRIENNAGYPAEMFRASTNVSIGLSNTYGSPTTVRTGSNTIKFFKARITWGGTFATGETVTVRIEVVYHDGTTAYVEKSATAVGSTWLTDDDILTLTKNASYISKINLYAKTSATTTSVTVTVDIYGHG